MANTFCALPWKHLTINHYGGAQVCCISRSMIREDNSDVSLYTRSLDEVFNAESIRKVRRNMLEGEASSECTLCYENEANGLRSERLDQNADWYKSDGFTIEKAQSVTAPDGSTSIKRPVYYQLMISNVCNLACRMCNGESSSKIENDPVHGAWAPGYNNFEVPKWNKDIVNIGPEQKLGVTRNGIRESLNGKTQQYLIDSQASFSIPKMDKAQPFITCELAFKLVNSDNIQIKVSIDNQLVLQSKICKDNLKQTVTIPKLNGNKKDLLVTIDILKDKPSVIHLESISLTRQIGTSKNKEMAISRFPDKTKSLFDQDSFLFDELMGSVETLQRLYVVGGEPFYAKPFLKLMDYLDDTGECSHIDAIFTSNATIVNDKLIGQLQKFRSVKIGFSVEGYGATQEYIRYPSNWQEIETNIKKFKELDGVKMHVVATLQFQTALYLTELLKFCDKFGILCGVNLVYFPDYLNILALPQDARIEAAEKLERYFTENSSNEQTRQNKVGIQPIINHLRSDEDMFNKDLLRKFMLFTNDLDQSRDQSFKETFPELLSFIEATGFRWTTETLHMTKSTRKHT